MGNLHKYTRGNVTAIVNEAMRVDDSIKYDPTTHDIDYSRSHLNYSLLNTPDEGLERYERRLSEVFCQNRADVNTLVTWVWTAPKDLPQEYHQEFFQGIHDFLAKRHGIENVVYSRVHLDETSDHMQMGFIPVVEAPNKKQGYKVSAKDVATKEYLSHIHAELQIYLEQRLGVEVNLLNGESLGVKGIKEYKAAKELSKTVAALDQEITEKKELIKELDQEILAKKGILQKLTETIDSLKEKVEKTIEHFQNYPNMLHMFLHWASKGRYSKSEEKDILEQYGAHLERARHIDHGLDR